MSTGNRLTTTGIGRRCLAITDSTAASTQPRPNSPLSVDSEKPRGKHLGTPWEVGDEKRR